MKKFNYIIAILALIILTITACGGDDTTIYKVTFDPDNGNPVFTQNVVDGTWAIQPQTPVKEAFPTTAGLYLGTPPVNTFIEWQYNGTAFNFDSPITSNITLTAYYSLPLVDTVVANNVADAVDYVRTNANQGEFTLILSQNFTAEDVLNFNTANMKLTIIGIGSERTIQVGSVDNRLFLLNANEVSLTLGQNITLNGINNSTNSLVQVSNGNLTMLNGSKITGHTTDILGGVVGVTGINSNFTMNGGEITGNHNDSTNASASGGIIITTNATFTMSGGSITGNTKASPPEAMDVVIDGATAINNSTKTGGTIGVSIPAEFAGN